MVIRESWSKPIVPSNRAFANSGGTCLGCLDKCFPEEDHVRVICGLNLASNTRNLSPQPCGERSPILRAPVFGPVSPAWRAVSSQMRSCMCRGQRYPQRLGGSAGSSSWGVGTGGGHFSGVPFAPCGIVSPSVSLIMEPWEQAEPHRDGPLRL